MTHEDSKNIKPYSLVSMLILALLVGIITGFGAVGFRAMIGLVHNLFFYAGSFAGGIGYSFIMAYATTASFIFQKHFLLSPVVFGWLGIFIGATNILGKHYNAVLSLKISLSKLLMLGNYCVSRWSNLLVGGLLLLIFSKETNFLTALIPITLCTFGIGFIMGNAMILAMSEFQEIKGLSASAYGTVQILLSFIISMIISYFVKYNVLTLASTYFILGICGMIFSYFAIKPRGRR